MTRTRTFVATLATATVAVTLAACGGVDRDGTRKELVSSFEESGIEIDADCVDTVFEKYSDDDLQAIDETLGNNETTAESDALLAAIFTCVPSGG